MASLALGAFAVGADAQPAGSANRVGYLVATSYLHPNFSSLFHNALNDLGYVEGRNLVVESRLSAGRDDRLGALAAELVQARVKIIVADGIAAALAAKQTTKHLPIVVAIGGDPVATGLVTSLARPGGNVTGVTVLALDLLAKRLQLLKEVNPRLTRVGVLWNPLNAEKQLEWQQLSALAPRLNLTLQSLEVRSPQDIDPALRSAPAQRVGGLLVLDDSLVLANASPIVDAAQKYRLPTIYAWRLFVDGVVIQPGGLMSYGPNLFDVAATVAGLVDKILRGANPADLPIEQPTKFELVVNLRAARALNVTIPPSLLVRADSVVR
jgi:putative ABC transport system substrate-binding protein